MSLKFFKGQTSNSQPVESVPLGVHNSAQGASKSQILITIFDSGVRQYYKAVGNRYTAYA
jgi:hypothetical protein